MTERGRVVLIFGIVALIAGAGGFYFFKVYQPAEALAAAQEEIATWETSRYQDARGCLLGKTPGSTKTSEALAIREMAPDPWERGKCTPVVSKLARGEANDTGVEAVEAAWTELDKAAQKAAIAFAKHVGSSTTLGDDPLPSALDELDAARAKLRAAAKLPPAAQIGTPLQPAQIVPVVDGTEALGELRVSTLPSAHGLVAYGKTGSREVQAVFATGAAPKLGRIGPGSMRAVPDMTWGATASRLVARGTGKAQDSTGTVKAGAMNVEGVIATPTELTVVAPLLDEGALFDPGGYEPGEEVGSIQIAAAAGPVSDGVVVYGAYKNLSIARSKGGAFTAAPPIKIDVATASADLDGRIAIVWTTVDKIHKALLVRAGGEDAFELPASFEGAPCMTKDRVWVMGTNDEVFAFGGGQPLARIPVGRSIGLQGCTADAAILRSRSAPREIAICTNECRKVLLPSGAPESSVVTAVGGKLWAFSSHAGVLGVWTEDKPARFYSLPMQARPVRAYEWPAMAMTDGKVVDIVAQATDAIVVIRIPAS
jgi:hypothetical protein